MLCFAIYEQTNTNTDLEYENVEIEFVRIEKNLN